MPTPGEPSATPPEPDREPGGAETGREPEPARLPWLAAIPFVALFAFALLLAARPIRTPDVWFHVACGRVIRADGIPRSNIFTDPGGRPWTDHEWGFQVLAS